MVIARRTAFTAATLTVAAALVSACGGQQDAPIAAAHAESSGVSTPPGPAATTTGTSNGQTYTVRTASIDGNTPDLRGMWKATRQEISGGDAAVARAFDDAAQALVRGQLGRAIADAGEGSVAWEFEASGQITFRATAIAQVVNGVFFFGDRPTSYVGAVVIDSRTAGPITTADLFTDEKAGLRRLSAQTKILLPRGVGRNTVMADAPGNAPTAANFATWIPLPAGLELHFPGSQFGTPAAQTITVPWHELTDVLAPKMAALATG